MQITSGTCPGGDETEEEEEGGRGQSPKPAVPVTARTGLRWPQRRRKPEASSAVVDVSGKQEALQSHPVRLLGITG